MVMVPFIGPQAQWPILTIVASLDRCQAAEKVETAGASKEKPKVKKHLALLQARGFVSTGSNGWVWVEIKPPEDRRF